MIRRAVVLAAVAAMMLPPGGGASAAAAEVAAPPVALDVYGRLPVFEMAAISGSGTRIALIGSVKDQRYLLVLGADNKIQRAFPVGDMKIDWLKWAGDDLLLMQHRNTEALGIGFTADKAELRSVTVLSVASGAHQEVFGQERSITGGVQGFFGLMQRDSRWYGFFSGAVLDHSDEAGSGGVVLTSTRPALYEVELATGRTRQLAKRADSQLLWRDWVLATDGTVAATLNLNQSSGEWHLSNAARKELVAGENRAGGVDLLGLAATADHVLYEQEDEASGDRYYYQVPLAGGAREEVLPDVAVIQPVEDPRTRQLIGYVSDEDYPQVRFFDEAHNAAVRGIAKAFPGRHMRVRSWSDSFRRYIVTTEGPTDPGTWWFVDIDSGVATPLGSSYLVPGAQVGAVSVVRYHAADGTQIDGVLTLPPHREAKNLPVILLPHGGPADRDYPGFHWWAQAFAEQGYAVFQPNFRGSTGYGPAFERAGHGEWGRKMQTDISDGLAELARQGIVDPKRACIMGGSYGGYAALAGVSLQQGIYRCAVSVAGVSDVGKMKYTDQKESGYRSTTTRALEDMLGKGTRLQDISPVNFAQRVDVPVLLIHGKDDTVVAYAQSTAMASALRNAGKSVELVTLDGEDHWLSHSATRLAMLQHASEFIRRYNPPD